MCPVTFLLILIPGNNITFTVNLQFSSLGDYLFFGFLSWGLFEESVLEGDSRTGLEETM